MSIGLMQSLSLIFFIAAVVLAVVAVILFFLLDMRKAYNDLTDRTAKNATDDRRKNTAGKMNTSGKIDMLYSMSESEIISDNFEQTAYLKNEGDG